MRYSQAFEDLTRFADRQLLDTLCSQQAQISSQ